MKYNCGYNDAVWQNGIPFYMVEFQKACISFMFLNNPHFFMCYYLFVFIKIYFKRDFFKDTLV